MNNRQKQIGFSQRIRLEWLQYTANLVLAGNDKGAVNSSLQELLKDKVSVGGKAVRGNKEKAITILMKIWLNVPGELEAVRDDGLELLKTLPRKDDGRPTHAAVRLFCGNPQRYLPTSEVKCLHSHGTEVRKPIPSYQIFKGSSSIRRTLLFLSVCQ